MASTTFQHEEENREIIFMFEDEHRFLSNFIACKVTLPEETVFVDGALLTLPEMEFDSVENAYMAWKTVDLGMREHIKTLSAGQAKKYSRKDDFIVRPDICDEKRVKIMRILTLQKYSQRNPELLAQLLATNNATIIEGNTWGDSFFGFDLINGFGFNHLGLTIMETRAVHSS